MATAEQQREIDRLVDRQARHQAARDVVATLEFGSSIVLQMLVEDLDEGGVDDVDMLNTARRHLADLNAARDRAHAILREIVEPGVTT